MKKMNNKGFTLVELLAVIVVLALLMVVATTSIGSALSSAKKKALQSETQKLLSQTYKDVQSEILMGIVGNVDIVKSGDDGDYTYKIVFDKTGAVKSYGVLYTAGKMAVNKTLTPASADVPNVVLDDVIENSTLTTCP